jgi:hypothetical protein
MVKRSYNISLLQNLLSIKMHNTIKFIQNAFSFIQSKITLHEKLNIELVNIESYN